MWWINNRFNNCCFCCWIHIQVSLLFRYIFHCNVNDIHWFLRFCYYHISAQEDKKLGMSKHIFCIWLTALSIWFSKVGFENKYITYKTIFDGHVNTGYLCCYCCRVFWSEIMGSLLSFCFLADLDVYQFADCYEFVYIFRRV